MSCSPTAAEMAQLQSDAASIVCDQTCVIQRLGTYTPTAQGGNSATYATTVMTVAGINQPRPSILTNYAYLIGTKSAWSVRLPNGTDVRANDHLIIGGKTLYVEVVLTPQSYSVFTNCIASEVE